MISVCMATFNGSAYVEQQLLSILPQLEHSDEIVLVDDCSTDTTLDVIRKIGDERIKIHRNFVNQGVLQTFDRAIGSARGDIIFLCDQDDIWMPGKVSQMMGIFRARPEVTLVLSDANIIDASGSEIRDSFFRARGGFRPGMISNVIKNGYLGCTMAFRHSLVSHILPFPKDIPMHDMWIGCLGNYYGVVSYINSPLISYRRHGKNASPAKRQSLGKMLYWRWKLMKNLMLRILRN